jgi:hypothetical protein
VAATGGINEQQCIWLWLIVQIQAYYDIVAGFDARSMGFVIAKPGYQMGMLMTMIAVTYRGWHVDHSFDEFSLFQVRHCLIAALKLSAR